MLFFSRLFLVDGLVWSPPEDFAVSFESHGGPLDDVVAVLVLTVRTSEFYADDGARAEPGFVPGRADAAQVPDAGTGVAPDEIADRLLVL